MSFVEELCETSLRLVLEPRVELLRNFRPDWLKNKATGRNLELDFYLPEYEVGFEIQGPSHYEMSSQIARDELKRELLTVANVTLFELSVFQVAPNKLHRKLQNYSFSRGILIPMQRYDHSAWRAHTDKIAAYKNAMQMAHGHSDCQVAVATLRHLPRAGPKLGDWVLVPVRGRLVPGNVLAVHKRQVEVRVGGRTYFVKHDRVEPFVPASDRAD